MDVKRRSPSRPVFRRPRRRLWRVLLPVALVLAGLVVASSSLFHFPVNPPLAHADPDAGYRYEALGRFDNSDSLLVFLSFSGGGTRAAAFSYGILEALRDRRVLWEGRERRLLDEVDYISSVSGSSFTAAYYGLYRDRLFEDFEADFLRRDVQGDLFRQLANPLNWLRIMSTRYGRSEVASNYFDRRLFKGATYADLQRMGKPQVVINATDLAKGVRFGFHQNEFDWICSDLAQVPVARAVAASSAVPLLLTPVTLKSYAGSCDFRAPIGILADLAKQDLTSRAYYSAARLAAYSQGRDEYVHLVDGGVSDNLGLRSLMDTVYVYGGAGDMLSAAKLERAQVILMIVSNAQTHAETGWDRSPTPPSNTRVVLSSARVPINQYNFETIALMRESLREWDRSIRAARCRGSADSPSCRPIRFYLVEMSFRHVPDREEARYLAQLPTAFRLPDGAVSRLRRAAHDTLAASDAFQLFLHDLERE